MKILSQITERLTNIAMIAVLAMMLLTVADVFMRYVFTSPITGTTELTEYGMIVITFCALGSVTFLRKHIAVDLVVERFTPRVQAAINIITLSLSLATCIFLAWFSFVEAVITQGLHITSSLLDIPDAIFRYIMAVGFAVVCLVALFQLIENIAKAIKK